MKQTLRYKSLPNYYEAWYKRHSLCAQRRIGEYPPDRMYRLKTNGLIVPIHRYVEDNGQCNTCVVKVLRVNNPQYRYKDIALEVAFSDLEMVRS